MSPKEIAVKSRARFALALSLSLAAAGALAAAAASLVCAAALSGRGWRGLPLVAGCGGPRF